MDPTTTQETLGDELRSRRRHSFVGRSTEIALFKAALDDADPGFDLLHISGPGGIGKSMLLGAYAECARAAGACVVELDCREVNAGPTAVLDALAEHLDIPIDGGPITARTAALLVILVDGYENLTALDGWVREDLLPRLPARTLVVLAGRDPVPSGWRADPAWLGRLRAIALRNLEADECEEYLRRRDVPQERHADIVRLTYGHPLALSLISDCALRDPSFSLNPMPGDLVRLLLGVLVTEAPSVSHRATLETAAIARCTDEDLLRHVLPDPGSAHDRFNWLIEQSFIEPVRDGLAPHDLVRDLMDAEARWRDQDGYRTRFRAVQEHALARVRKRSGAQQQRAIADLKYCFRQLRSVMAPVSWGTWGEAYPDHARPEDRAVILDILRSVDGEASAALAAHWWDRQPEAFWVIRQARQQVRGVIAMLDLTAATDADRQTDPGTAAAWAHVEQQAPPRAGESVTQCRFIADAEAGQGPSPTLNVVPILTLQRQLALTHLAWDFVTLAEPDRWDEFFMAADLPRAEGADFWVGGRRFGLFAHDFRRVTVETMIRRWTERALADDALLVPPDVPTEFLVLAKAEFSEAVRQGLRNLHRPDLLSRSPLMRTRLLLEHSGSPGDGERLADLLRNAVEGMAEDDRDDRPLRAVRATYLTRLRTQEAAAAALGLPFSTYRRHLARGLDRLIDSLWQRELGHAPVNK